jgi:alpha-tubulin suppressor-like RCC1 family protein
MEHENVSRGHTIMKHVDIIRGLALGLVLAACTRADSRDTAENREHSGAARRVVPPDVRPPVDARPPGRRIEHVTAGFEHTCVLFHDGAVRCWGMGEGGRLGTGATATIGDDETPAAIPDVDLGGRAVQIAAGRDHTCALLDIGKVRCWGANNEGQLGYGHTRSIGDDEAPASAGDVPLDEPVTQIVAGAFYTCALLASGRVRCWGGRPGQTGNDLDHGSIGDDELPTAYPALEMGGRVTQLISTHGFPCALLENGSVPCWEPVTSATANRYTPATEHPLLRLGVPIMPGADHTCAITATGRLRCWGGGSDAKVGYSVHTGDVGVTRGELPTPARLGEVPVTGNRRVIGVALGGELTCILLDTGRVRCWGEGLVRVHDPGSPEHIFDKHAVEVDVGGRVVEIAAGAYHACAVLDTRRVRCWGANREGQLGYGLRENVGEKRSPAAVGDVPL